MNVSGSENCSQIDQDYFLQKAESIKMAFSKQDKNLDSVIDQSELYDFLDGNSKSGKFDRNLANKIFSILDNDKNGKITTQEFINSYVGFIKDIKGQLKDLESSYKFEDKNRAKLELLVRNNVNEVLNEEQLGQNSKFTIEIINIDYLRNKLAFDGILIKIAFGDRIETTKILSTYDDDLVWQQKFEL